jgi:hypothetical protein
MLSASTETGPCRALEMWFRTVGGHAFEATVAGIRESVAGGTDVRSVEAAIGLAALSHRSNTQTAHNEYP